MVAWIQRGEPMVIAVDGGGSTCRCLLATAIDDTTTEYLYTETGAANVFSDFSSAIIHISQGIEQLVQKANIPDRYIGDLPVYLGLAGAINQHIIDRVTNALSFSRIKVENDHPAAIRGALGTGDGAVAHLGTGSFFGMQRDGRHYSVGGWGPELGDEGSAYKLGCEALRMALWAQDGLIETTPFCKEVSRHFDQQGESMVRFVRHASPSEIADYARAVIQFAQLDDPVACAIVHDSTQLITDILTRMGWYKGLPLCLTGGLGEHYKQFFNQAVQASIVPAQHQPVHGALTLAREFWQEITS